MVSVDQGFVSLFISAESKITPATPRPDGYMAGAHGWYGFPPASGDYVHGKDQFIYKSGGRSAGGDLAFSPLSASLTTYFLMQASDSVTQTLYTWTVINAPDWTGTHYPGPNSATNVAVTFQHAVVVTN